MAGLHACLKDVVKKVISTASLECVTANLRGGGTTSYIITVSPARTGDVYVSMECEVTPVKRMLVKVKGLENGKVYKPREPRDADDEESHHSATA